MKSKRPPMKPIQLYIALDNGSPTRLSGGLGLKDDLPCGCHFIAAFYRRRFATKAAAEWGDARVVPVEIRERGNGDTDIRKALDSLMARTGGSLIGWECGHGISFTAACPDCKAGPVADCLTPPWPTNNRPKPRRAKVQPVDAGALKPFLPPVDHMRTPETPYESSLRESWPKPRRAAGKAK